VASCRPIPPTSKVRAARQVVALVPTPIPVPRPFRERQAPGKLATQLGRADALLVAEVTMELDSAGLEALTVTKEMDEELGPAHSTAEFRQPSTGTPGDCKKSWNELGARHVSAADDKGAPRLVRS
jgi:hypothetical protein